MWELIYEILVSPLGLPISPIWEYFIILILGEVAHEIAYWVSPGGKAGSFIYWSTKLLTFVGVWAVLYGIITAVQFVIAHWIWFTIGGIILISIAVIIIIIRKKKNRLKEISN